LEVGLGSYENVFAGSLSEGQRKRINLARFYLLDSPVWLLDEPFSAIDIEGVAKLEERFQDHIANGGSIILTSHQAIDIDQTIDELILGGAS
jgi:heme exporter protein A